MPLPVVCPSCARGLAAPDAAAGRSSRCPNCRFPVAVPMPFEPPDEPVRELAFRLQNRVRTAFIAPILGALEGVKAAQTVEELLAAREPGRIRRACSRGINAVAEMAEDEQWPAPVRKAIAGLEARRDRLMRSVAEAFEEVAATAEAVHRLDIPQGTVSGFVRDMGDSKYQAASQLGLGVGAVAGAVTGVPILTVLGAMLGGAWAAKTRDSREAAIGQQYDRAWQGLLDALEALSRRIWDAIARQVPAHGGPALPDSARFDEVERACTPKDLVAALTADLDDRCAPTEELIRKWGPACKLLDRHVFNALELLRKAPDRDLEARARWHSEKLLRLYPEDPASHVRAAELALHELRHDAALAHAERGLHIAPADGSLLEVKAEVLAALGRPAEATAVAGNLPPDKTYEGVRRAHDVRMAAVRGSVRAGNLEAAVQAVQVLLEATHLHPAAVARRLRQDGVTGPVANQIVKRVRVLEKLPGGRKGEWLGILGEYLWHNGTTSFLGEIPDEVLDACDEAFVRLKPEESLLYYYDWSYTNSRQSGIAITNRRVVWASYWGGRTNILLRDVRDGEVRAEGLALHIAAESVATESEPMAWCLANAIDDLRRHLAESSKS